MKILVVDDDTNICGMLKILLNTKGHQVNTYLYQQAFQTTRNKSMAGRLRHKGCSKWRKAEATHVACDLDIEGMVSFDLADLSIIPRLVALPPIVDQAFLCETSY
jgi:DNA-binding response OmpR family regulator